MPSMCYSQFNTVSNALRLATSRVCPPSCISGHPAARCRQGRAASAVSATVPTDIGVLLVCCSVCLMGVRFLQGLCWMLWVRLPPGCQQLQVLLLLLSKNAFEGHF